ncbi:hypothetical protein KAI46_13720 [bacterium]|nr:hypothetical protein [bacterium]
MTINYLRLLAFLPLLSGLLISPSNCLATENSFRLIYIGSLSGYVKLCG